MFQNDILSGFYYHFKTIYCILYSKSGESTKFIVHFDIVHRKRSHEPIYVTEGDSPFRDVVMS